MIDYQFKYNSRASKYKAISLFAGAGGCSLGFSKYGVNVLGAYDIWQEAVDTYNQNFGLNKAHVADLAKCDFAEIRDGLGLQKGELDIIIGGPPCQGFSTLGKRGEDDPRNRLLLNYAKALEIFYPRWFMMENVEGMLTTAKGDFIIEAIERMIALGYSVYVKKVYMHEYGIPQRRKRVIIIGNREGKYFDFPETGTVASGFRYKYGTNTLYDAIADIENEDIPQINHVRRTEEGIKLKRIESLCEGGTMKDLPKELQHESYAKRAARRVCDGIPSEKRGGAPSGLKRLVYSEPCLTITGSSTSEFVHPKANRMLTIRECARVQTFPDDFIFYGSNSQQEQQIGNAIPPLFANIIAEQIYKSDNAIHSALCQSGLIYYDVTKSSAKSPALALTCKRLDQLLVSLFNHD